MTRRGHVICQNGPVFHSGGQFVRSTDVSLDEKEGVQNAKKRKLGRVSNVGLFRITLYTTGTYSKTKWSKHDIKVFL